MARCVVDTVLVNASHTSARVAKFALRVNRADTAVRSAAAVAALRDLGQVGGDAAGYPMSVWLNSGVQCIPWDGRLVAVGCALFERPGPGEPTNPLFQRGGARVK